MAILVRGYRRQDEIGTPYCVTINFQTLEDDTVTLRDEIQLIKNALKLIRSLAKLESQAI